MFDACRPAIHTRGMALALGIVIGIVLVVVLRIALSRALLVKLRRDVKALGNGNYGPLLAGYSSDAVLSFNDGDHRWAGEHRGKPAIEAFLAEFVRAGIHGDITEAYMGGWPWSMTLVVRFDDRAEAPDGTQIYENNTVLLARTRWGKIVRQEDFYYDTVRMTAFDRKLTELGIGAP